MTTEKDPKRGYDEEEDELVPEDDRVIGTAFRGSMIVIGVIAVIVVAYLLLSGEKTTQEASIERNVEGPASLDQKRAEMPSVQFTDITQEAGIDFVHVSGARGEKFLPETMGSGAAFFDYDGDGDADLLFANAKEWDSNGGATMALYANDGSGNFSDVTAAAGLAITTFGQGVAIGDYDRDGDPDLFLATLGRDRMFRNDGGRFTDVTREAGVAGEADRWSSSAGFFDYDNDGDLDLFVCTYVAWSREFDIQLNFSLNGVDRAYGPPKDYPGAHSRLYRNEGDGRFTDVSAEAGVEVVNPATGRAMGKALAVTFADADDDGFIDIFVANDTVQNFVFHNLGNGRFEEVGATSGVAFDARGNATGAMGIDAAAYANDSRLGIGIGNFANETTSFYVQQRNAWQFVDVANAAGIGSPSRLSLSFGLFFFDYDLDGWLDMLQTNGHLEEEITELQPSQHYRQASQLFWNEGSSGKSGFVAVPEESLGDYSQKIVGRGAAYADIDADGDLDVVLTQTGDRPLLLRNDQSLGHHWLRLHLIGERSNIDAIGAEVELKVGDAVQRRRVMPSRSYLSQVEPTLTFGLGDATAVDSVTIHWPSGQQQQLSVDSVDQLLVVREGADG